MMKKIALAFLICFLLVSNHTLALTGDEILKKAEDAMNAPQDRAATQKMILVKADGSEKQRDLKFYQKGSDKRLVVFLSPEDVKGIGFLSISEEQMYLYLPAFRKVRRIASHIKNEDFVGTDFAYEDIAETEYTDDYTAVSTKEEASSYVLELVPRPDADVSYSKELMWVDKMTFIPTRIEYYSKSGKLIKILSAESVEQVDGYWFPMKMGMETVKTGHKTLLEIVEIEHDTGLSDDFFTQRNLKRQAR
jgi:outer membrane lipoprotein-sorting protein